MSTKALYLIRHGKAEVHSFLKRDYDRNLVEKGRERSKVIAHKLIAHLQPNRTLVISSTANRAIETAQIFCEILNYPVTSLQLEKSIYEAHYKEILKVINKNSDDIDTLILFGHNPGLSDLTNYLCNSYIDLKTSHVAKIILPDNFNFPEVSGNTCQLETIITE